MLGVLKQLYQNPTGFLVAEVNLRSLYDSTQVWADGVRFTTIAANTYRQEEVVQIPVMAAGTKTVFLRSFAGGNQHQSVTKTWDVFEPVAPVYEYANDFQTPSDDFAGSLFRIGPEAGFPGGAIHSAHPYDDGTNPIYQLKVPIRVAHDSAFIAFDELALVEPGDPGTVFGDAAFWDYVIVEGSANGLTWVPLAPGWDCRAYPEWESAYYAYAPDPSLLRRRTINLRDTFTPNQVILVRFRLYADGAVNGWGWIVDNLAIQIGSTTAVAPGTRAPVLALGQSIPNPLRTTTTIGFALPSPGPARLDVFDVQGRLVRRLVSEPQTAGGHEVTWDGRDDGGARVAGGVYFYRLSTKERVLQRRLTVLR